MIRYIANLVAAGYCPGQENFDNLSCYESPIVLGLTNIREKFGRDAWENAARLKKAGGKMFVSYIERGAGNVHDYISFLEWNREVIQERNGRLMYTGIAYERDEQQCWNALRYLESRGFSPIPTYVIGHDVRLLDYYCKTYPDVVIIGAEGSARRQIEVLDHLWTNYVINDKFETKARMHAVELSSPALINRYNWYSCDTAEWVRLANAGDIITDTGSSVCVAKNDSKMMTGKHILTLSEIESAAIREKVAEAGFDMVRLSERKESRAVYNIRKILQSKNGGDNIKSLAKPMIQGLF